MVDDKRLEVLRMLGEGSGEAGPSALNPPAGRDAETPEDSENEKSVSFGERLRASKDDEDQESEEKKLNYTEQDGASICQILLCASY